LTVPSVTEVFVIACDMPFINGILIKHMKDRWDDRRDALIPVFEGKTQPLFGIYSKKIAEKMREYLHTGRRGLRRLLEGSDVLYIGEEEVRDFDKDGRSFVNINTMEDFHREGGKICSERRI